MADDPKAGTVDDQPEGGTPEGAGTPVDDPQGGTEGEQSPEQIKAELERLKAAQAQWLGEKDANAKRIRELEERAATPPTPDPGIQNQINAEQEELAALERAASQGDPVAKAHMRLKQQVIEELQYQQIPEGERGDVRAFYAKNKHRFSDPQAAMYALRGLKADFDARQAAAQPKPEPKPAPAKPTVATGARHVPAGDGGGTKPMAFTDYLAKIGRGGPEAEKLKAEKDASRLLIDYSR